MTITAAVDGSALGNPGPAGWAWVVSEDCWDSGGWDHGTNNLGELTAVLQLLRATADAGLAGEPLHVLADSQYAINTVTKWRHGWKKRGWQKADKKPIKNLEVVQALDRAMEGRSVTFEWVRGHAGHPMNERADDLARGAAEDHQRGRVAPGGPGFGGRRGAGKGTGNGAGDGPGKGIDEGGPGAGDAPGTGTAPGDGGTPGAGTAPAAGTPPTPGGTHSTGAAPATRTSPATAEDVETATATGTGTETATATGRTVSSDPAEVLDSEKAFIRAWAAGDEQALENLANPEVHRVWPDGSSTRSLWGRAPDGLRVGRMRPTDLGGGSWLVVYRLSWEDGMSLESSVWTTSPGGTGSAGKKGGRPRLLWHQSTPRS